MSLAGFARARAESQKTFKRVLEKSHKMGYGTTRTFKGGSYSRYLKSGKRIERKWLDSSYGGTQTSSSGQITNASLCLISAGTGESERIGRSIKISKISVRGMVTLIDNSNPLNTKDTVRIILYEDKQCNGATAAVTDILQTASYFSFNNLSNSHRFKVLKSTTVTLNATATVDVATIGTASRVHKPFQIDYLCNCPIEYSGTTAVIGGIRSRNLGIMAISTDGLTILQYTARIRYRDS